MAVVVKDNEKIQKKFNITFRENEVEVALYDWVNKKGIVGGVCNYVKNVLYNEMLKEKEGK